MGRTCWNTAQAVWRKGCGASKGFGAYILVQWATAQDVGERTSAKGQYGVTEYVEDGEVYTTSC